MTVIRSTIPSLVGIEGIVSLETKNVFQITGKDNITRSKYLNIVFFFIFITIWQEIMKCLSVYFSFLLKF